jgi:hypothetical protein
MTRFDKIFDEIIDGLRETCNITGFVQSGINYIVSVNDVTNLSNNDTIVISGTTNFNGTYVISSLTTTTFNIVKSGTYISETGICTNKKPYFIFADWREVAEELARKGQTPSLRFQKWPLVILHSDFIYDVQKTPGFQGEINPKIYILMVSEPNLTSTQRLASTYVNTIYPLYDELIEAIGNYSLFNFEQKGGSKLVKHKVKHFLNQNQICDVVDALEIEFEYFKVYRECPII